MSAWRLGLVAIGLLSASPALAWGDDGHRLVCQIAYERLDGAAKAKLDAIIASNPNGAKSFAEACTYPDKWRARFKDDPIKARTEHHYINLRRSTLSITSETCGTARPEQGCAFTAITSDFAALSDHAASANERWRALVFLGHFVGDIHQPLHVSFADDAGGNGLHTRGDCTDLSIDNMHSVWDTCIIRKYIYQRMVKPADFFSDPLFHTVAEELANVPPADESSWLATPRFMWGQESFAITTSPEVGYCKRAKPTSPCKKVGTVTTDSHGKKVRSVTLEGTPSYSASFAPTIRLRLQQAGVRLAALLQSAL